MSKKALRTKQKYQDLRQKMKAKKAKRRQRLSYDFWNKYSLGWSPLHHSLKELALYLDVSLSNRSLKNSRTVFANHRKSIIQKWRAKRATFTFWVDKSWLKMPKMIHFGEFLKTWSLRSNSVTRQVSFNRTKIGGKCQN